MKTLYFRCYTPGCPVVSSTYNIKDNETLVAYCPDCHKPMEPEE